MARRGLLPMAYARILPSRMPDPDIAMPFLTLREPEKSKGLS
jgi:hypothetical protein